MAGDGLLVLNLKIKAHTAAVAAAHENTNIFTQLGLPSDGCFRKNTWKLHHSYIQ